MRIASQLSVLSLFYLCVTAFSGCSSKSGNSSSLHKEDRFAKKMLQGIWVDDESEEVVFRIKGDSVFYPDSATMPAYFKIVADTFVVDGGSQQDKYPVVKRTYHTFWFKNTNGDFVKLIRSNDPADTILFSAPLRQPVLITEKVKRDTVVYYDEKRYHCYITINPTKYKVVRSTYSDDGMALENVYYDNIVHLGVYQGKRKVFSRNVAKQEFAKFVPGHFISQAILGDMLFNNVDDKGFHFQASLCLPDGNAVSYLLDVCIGFGGQFSVSFKK